MILASDYDYTLRFEDGVRQEDLEMIKAFRKKNGKFGLVSGRSISALQAEVKKHKIPCDFIIGVNGGFIVDENNNEIFNSFITTEDAINIMSFLDQNPPLSYTIHDGYQLARKIFNRDFILEIDVEFIEIEALIQQPVSGFFINYESEAIAKENQAYLNKHFPRIHAQRNSTFVDVCAPNINKAIGLSRLQDHKKWAGNLWVVGDGLNDLQMIQSFSSFAIKSGESILQKYADYTVESIAEAIEILINSSL